MTPLFLYLIKSSISLSILVLLFELVQKRETFFDFNRAYLLAGILLALLLPFWNFNILNIFLPNTAAGQEILITYQLTTYTLPEVTIGKTTETFETFSWLNTAIYVYLTGVIIKTGFLVFRGFQLVRLLRMTRSIISNGLRIVFTQSNLPVFSFFNNIFISENTYKSKDAEKIIAHEKVHIAQLHSIDLLIAELVCILQWFNPFAYLLKKLIRENHEFLADKEVISSYGDATAYRLLLLNHSTMVRTNSLAHNFSYSLLKRRLFMTTKPKKKIRFGFSILSAGLAFMLVLFACSQPDKTDLNAIADEPAALTEDVYENVEVMPEYPGGMESLSSFLSSNISYPEKAKNEGVEGKVMVSFIIDKSGSVRETKAINEVGYGLEEEAVRVVNMMPDWKPGMNEGKAVNVGFTLPILFALDGAKNKDTVFTVVKQMPEFPGGTDALMQFIGSNIKYPEQAKKDSITGKVFVSFVVEKDGSVDDVKILRGIGGGCDEESVRVILSMPNWIPGRDEDGNTVRVAYNIPIKFALN